MKKIPEPQTEEIQKRAPGIDANAVVALIKYLNATFAERSAPLYVYFNPDLEDLAKEVGVEPKILFKSFTYLSSFYSDNIKHEVIFDQDGIFYRLQEEDLLDLKNLNRLHNPDDPRIVYERARDLVRHAFVVNLDR